MIDTYNGIPVDIIREVIAIKNEQPLDFSGSTFLLFIIASVKGSQRLIIWAGSNPKAMPQLEEAIKRYIDGSLPDGATDEALFDD